MPSGKVQWVRWSFSSKAQAKAYVDKKSGEWIWRDTCKSDDFYIRNFVKMGEQFLMAGDRLNPMPPPLC